MANRKGKRALIVYVDDELIQKLDDMVKLKGLLNVLSDEKDTTRSSVARAMIEEQVGAFDLEEVAKKLSHAAQAIRNIRL